MSRQNFHHEFRQVFAFSIATHSNPGSLVYYSWPGGWIFNSLSYNLTYLTYPINTTIFQLVESFVVSFFLWWAGRIEGSLGGGMVLYLASCTRRLGRWSSEEGRLGCVGNLEGREWCGSIEGGSFVHRLVPSRIFKGLVGASKWPEHVLGG